MDGLWPTLHSFVIICSLSCISLNPVISLYRLINNILRKYPLEINLNTARMYLNLVYYFSTHFIIGYNAVTCSICAMPFSYMLSCMLLLLLNHVTFPSKSSWHVFIKYCLTISLPLNLMFIFCLHGIIHCSIFHNFLL